MSNQAEEPVQQSEAEQYRLEEVEFYSGAIKLSGTLALPLSPSPHPAVVLVHGSGPEPRKFNLIDAKRYASQGIAALAYDKRGVELSDGNWLQADYNALAGDVLAGVTFLSKHPAINPQQVGILGTSEGGWVVGLAASRSKQVAYVIFISAAGMTPAQQESYRRELILKANGYPWPVVKAGMIGWWFICNYCRLATKFIFLPAPGVAGFFGRTLDYNPLPVLEQIGQPVLAIWGEADKHVPAQKSRRLFEQALQKGNHPDYTFKLFPQADHFLQANGQPVPGKFETIVEWILQHTVKTTV